MTHLMSGMGDDPKAMMLSVLLITSFVALLVALAMAVFADLEGAGGHRGGSRGRDRSSRITGEIRYSGRVAVGGVGPGRHELARGGGR